jgi:ADP-heptose:LPS heptosyltransferase
MTPRRVLFIQLKMLGDILMLTPSIKAFKKKYPDSKLDVLVEPPGDVLLRQNPYVDYVIATRTKKWYSLTRQLSLIRTLRRRSYDLAVDFLGNPRSAHYTYLSGAKKRIGYDDTRFKYAYSNTYKRTNGYSAVSKLDFISFLDIPKDDFMPEFHFDGSIEIPLEMQTLNDRKLAVISPVSLRSHKIWPIAKFAEISRYIHDKYDFFSLVIAGPGEKKFLNEFSKAAKAPFAPLYIDNLVKLAAVIKKCDLFIGNDNGPKHIAVAMGLPTYAIFSHLSDPVCWTYPDPQRHKFIGGANHSDGLPIEQIRAAIVIDQLSDFIEGLGLEA